MINGLMLLLETIAVKSIWNPQVHCVSEAIMIIILIIIIIISDVY